MSRSAAYRWMPTPCCAAGDPLPIAHVVSLGGLPDLAAVEAGAISADRFHNYHRILETMQEARHGRQQARL